MITLEIVTQTGKIDHEKVHHVVLPTINGKIAVYPNHARLKTLLEPGYTEIIISDTKKHEIFTGAGIAEIANDKITLLVDTAERDEDFNEANTLNSINAAKEALANAKTTFSLSMAEANLEKHQTRLNLASLRRHKKR